MFSKIILHCYRNSHAQEGKKKYLGVVVHTRNPGLAETPVEGQPELHGETLC
jgi:hypothetical protein